MSSEDSNINVIRPDLKTLLSHLECGNLLEIKYPRLELKSQWDKSHGKKISAIANHKSQAGGWLIVGLDDKGILQKNSESWAKETEEVIGNQVNQFLSPYYSVCEIHVKDIEGRFFIILDIQSPGDVTEWDGEAYKLSGTSSTKMTTDERFSLAMQLPGEDFSNQEWSGPIDSSLVLNFVEKVAKADPGEFPEDLSTLSPLEILSRLHLKNKMAAGILFGDFPVRIGRYNDQDDVIDNTERKGAYNILTDDFISQIQAWTRKQGTIVEGNTASVKEESPYPPKVLREILSNAVAHALYQREKGGIIVDIYPDHLTVRNNAMLEAKAFSKQWFAKKTYVKNKLLMMTLRAAKITDELGSGKTRIFRLVIESGKREPLLEFGTYGNFGKWEITIYNNQQDEHLTSLIAKLYDNFPSPNHARIATALVLWREHKWSSILDRLDEYYKRIAFKVIEHQFAPIIVIGDDLFVKRWVNVALTGHASRSFTPAEEKQIEEVLKSFSFNRNRDGFVTTEEAKKIIGLGNSRPETTQLSNLFRSWRDKGIVQYIKRGHWKFISEDEKKNILMSKIFREVTS